jgi:hypothetical protein
MNRYQIFLLVCIYVGIAYGAYREHQDNKSRWDERHGWHVAFVFASTYLAISAFVFAFLFLGTL